MIIIRLFNYWGVVAPYIPEHLHKWSICTCSRAVHKTVIVIKLNRLGQNDFVALSRVCVLSECAMHIFRKSLPYDACDNMLPNRQMTLISTTTDSILKRTVPVKMTAAD